MLSLFSSNFKTNVVKEKDRFHLFISMHGQFAYVLRVMYIFAVAYRGPGGGGVGGSRGGGGGDRHVKKHHF